MRVGVRGHHLVLLLEQGNGPLGKGLAQWLLGVRGERREDRKTSDILYLFMYYFNRIYSYML